MARLFNAVIVLLLAFTLSGCGFRPLYGEAGGTRETTAKLERIKVDPARNTTDAVFRNYLLDRIAPGGKPDDYDYELAYVLNERQVGGGIRIDAAVTRFNVRLTANYKLRSLKDNKIVFEDSVTSNVAYDVVNSQFATLVERDNARERAARELSNNIVLRLSLFFDRADDSEPGTAGDMEIPADAS